MCATTSRAQLGLRDVNVISTGIYRENLRYEVPARTAKTRSRRGCSPASPTTRASGIVYTATVKHAEALTTLLRDAWRIAAERYHGRLTRASATTSQERFMRGELQRDRRDQRVRHGHRQAGHPVRDPLRHAGNARRLLSGIGPRRTRRRAGALRPAVSAARTSGRMYSSWPASIPASTTSLACTQRWAVSARTSARYPLSEIQGVAADVAKTKVRVVLATLKDWKIVKQHRQQGYK